MKAITTQLASYDLLNNPRLNKGTAFSEEERDRFELHGLLPPHLGHLEDQIERRRAVLEGLPDAFAKYSFLRDLQDTNETLFYALLQQDIPGLLPLVYTPTVGEGCMRFSQIWRKPRGLFLSYPNRHRIGQILANPRFDAVRCIVVSDGERILGLGDQGAGGMGIPVGKLALYTALGGIPPESCLPILLDVGTDNEERLRSPTYIGWEHHRVRGEDYDDFVEAFVNAVERRWPEALLQWEDFAGVNAGRLLARYRDRLCTFNDDIQGTAAAATATILAAIQVTGLPLREQRVVMVGFGSAGVGIADLLVEALRAEGLDRDAARSRIYAMNRYGLLYDGSRGQRADQSGYARPRAEVEAWLAAGSEDIPLLEVVRRIRPTVLIGVSGQPGVIGEDAVREMARHAERPIIFPLSNPTSRSEATPEDLLRWTSGKALIGTGSPFPPVVLGERTVPIAQTNNAYIFPGLALGIIASGARRVSDAMIMASAQALAGLSPTQTDKQAPLLPPIAEARAISRVVAEAVGRQALADGLARRDEAGFLAELEAIIWTPAYVPYRRSAL